MGFKDPKPYVRTDVLDVYQVADMTGATPRDVRSWIASGRLETTVVGNRQAITKAAVERFLRGLSR